MSNYYGIKSIAALAVLLMMTALPSQAEDYLNPALESDNTSVTPAGHRKNSKSSCTGENCTNSSCTNSDCKSSRAKNPARNARRAARWSHGKNGSLSKHASNKNGAHKKGAKGHYGSTCPPGHSCPSGRSSFCQTCRLPWGRCHHSPGHGWRPPGKNPIHRTAVGYTKYWPNYWSGQGPGTPVQAHPVVYTPTDTTQLGYSYARVPHWQARPGMLPAAPIPSQYHDRSMRYNHQNHFWGNFKEAHKWQHRVNYSEAVSAQQGYSNYGNSYGTTYSSCPTCQNNTSNESSYPTPVESGVPAGTTELHSTPTMIPPQPTLKKIPYNEGAKKSNTKKSIIKKTSLTVPTAKSVAIPALAKEPRLVPILVPLPSKK